MFTLMTYDVDREHVKVKQALFDLGYSDHFVYEGKKVYLPNTTVWHATKSYKTALTEMQAICSKLNVNLERCVAVEVNNWQAIYGKPF